MSSKRLPSPVASPADSSTPGSPKRLRPERRLASIHDVPFDVLVLVFMFFPERLRVLLFTRVCKFWRRVAHYTITHFHFPAWRVDHLLIDHHMLPNLVSFSLGFVPYFNFTLPSRVTSLAVGCLPIVHPSRISFAAPLRRLSLALGRSFACWPFVQEACSSVTELHLVGVESETAVDNSLRLHTISLPQLAALTLSFLPLLEDDILAFLQVHALQLHKLTVVGCAAFGDTWLHFASLTEMHLRTNIDLPTLTMMCHDLKRLRRLELSSRFNDADELLEFVAYAAQFLPAVAVSLAPPSSANVLPAEPEVSYADESFSQLVARLGGRFSLLTQLTLRSPVPYHFNQRLDFRRLSELTFIPPPLCPLLSAFDTIHAFLRWAPHLATVSVLLPPFTMEELADPGDPEGEPLARLLRVLERARECGVEQFELHLREAMPELDEAPGTASATASCTSTS